MGFGRVMGCDLFFVLGVWHGGEGEGLRVWVSECMSWLIVVGWFGGFVIGGDG